jgi:hypothetical protein
MSQRVLCLSPVRIKPGMRLARPVLRHDGAVLLPTGAELDSEQMEHLHQRGVEYVFVTDDEAQGEEQKAATAARIAHLFRGERGENLTELKEAILRYRLEGLR